MLSIFRNTFIFIITFLLSSNLLAQEKAAKPADEFAGKKPETKLTEVIAMDSIKGDELLKRATHWVKQESKKYNKANGVTANGKVECTVSFLIKPKELNPQVDYTGKIAMKVVIECKNDKYRYIVSEITHVSKGGTTSGGSIDNAYADCGSTIMEALLWKKIKGEGVRDATMVVADIKEAMQKPSTTDPGGDW